MALLKNKNNPKTYSPNSSYWKDVDQKAHSLIAEILKEKLPLTNLAKNLDLSQDEDYLALLPGYQAQYSDNLPEADQVSHEIAYEYLLIVIKSLVKTLKEFTCHDPEYMEEII